MVKMCLPKMKWRRNTNEPYYIDFSKNRLNYTCLDTTRTNKPFPVLCTIGKPNKIGYNMSMGDGQLPSGIVGG